MPEFSRVDVQVAPPLPALPWLEELRRQGSERFELVGYPTTKEEAWRFTSVTPITRTHFIPGDVRPNDAIVAALDESTFGSDATAELVFINGYYAPDLSRSELPKGVIAASWAQALTQHAGLVQTHLGKLADVEENPFVAINTSHLRDGAVVYVPRGVTIEQPIHLVFIGSAGERAAAAHPRILLIAEANSEATLVQSFIGAGGTHWVNPVTEIFGSADSRINYNQLQMSGEAGLAISTLAARLDRGAQFIGHCATLGGKLTRNELNVRLAGDGADATINGLVILDKDQHCDNHTLLDHAAAHCPSHELYKHVLSGKSSCVFHGQILVRPGAQKTDSKQSSKSLLLSDEAVMDSQPALEIYADDVKCTHGSTIGPVDEEMVFYLRSRGVSAEAARHLLSYAFAADVTRRIKVEPFRRRLEDFMAQQHGLPRDLRITDLGEHDEKAR